MIVERSMHPSWLSNAFLLADEPGGTAVFIDSGAPLEPLHEAVARERLNVTHLLTTHSHPDHVAGDDELVALSHEVDILPCRQRQRRERVGGQVRDLAAHRVQRQRRRLRQRQRAGAGAFRL